MRGISLVGVLVVGVAVSACGSPTASPSAIPGRSSPGSTQSPVPSLPGSSDPGVERGAVAAIEPWTFMRGEIRAVEFGTDGTTYLISYYGDAPSEVTALDEAGAVKAGWPRDVGEVGVGGGPIVTPDGDVLVLTLEYKDPGTISYALLRFGPDGTPRDGWPYLFAEGDECGGPRVDGSGDAIVACGSAGGSRAVAIDVYGDAVWDTTLPIQNANRIEIGTDGTIFTGSELSGDLAAISADGEPLAGWPVSTGAEAGFRAMPGGGVLAWWHEGAAQEICHTGGRTVYSVFGTDGLPLSGWPQSVTGYSSVPAIGADGVVYVVNNANHVLAINPDGAIRDGWPAQVAGTTGSCFGPPTPSLADDGTVFVITGGAAPDGSISAIGPDGHMLDGWPQTPQVEFAYPCRGCTPGPPEPGTAVTVGDLIFVAMYPGDPGLGVDVVGLNRDGAILPGWPAHIDIGEITLRAAPDGRLFGILVDPDNLTTTLAFLGEPN
jgi:outer membrane protein assembly factor BamB